MKEPGRERVKTARPFQVSKLQTFACNQRSGKGVLVRIQTQPRRLSLQETLLASPPESRRAGYPALEGLHPRGTPWGLLPCHPCQRWLKSGRKSSHGCTCRTLSLLEGGDVPLPTAWLLTRAGWGWGPPVLPQILFLQRSPVALSKGPVAVSYCLPPRQAPSTCMHTRAHSPEKTNDFAPSPLPLLSQTAPQS